MDTGMAHNGDVGLWWVSEGPVDATPVVLVNGAGSTAVMWDRSLRAALVGAGFRVIRFDNRDVGRSSRVPDRSPMYLVADMVADLLAVLYATGAARAHLLGRSMGGMIALQAARDHPDRVRSLTLVYSSPCLGDPAEFGLRGPRRATLEAMADAAALPPPTSDDDRIERRIAEARLLAGSRYAFAADEAEAQARADLAHAPHASPPHGMAVMCSPALVDDLPTIAAPALVVHGTEDPVIDVGHARLLAQRLPNVTLVELDGLGHEMPPAMVTEILPDLLDHLARS